MVTLEDLQLEPREELYCPRCGNVVSGDSGLCSIDPVTDRMGLERVPVGPPVRVVWTAAIVAESGATA